MPTAKRVSAERVRTGTDAEPDDKGMAPGISNLLGVAVYATVLVAAGYRAAFLTAAGQVTLFGTVSMLLARR